MPSPTPQELTGVSQICDNGQDDDGQIDAADSDCATQPPPTPSTNALPGQGFTPTPTPTVTPAPAAGGLFGSTIITPSPTPTPTPRPLQGVIATPTPDLFRRKITANTRRHYS